MYEECVIGTVINDPSSIADVLDISPQDFQSRQHKVIWTQALDLFASSALSQRTLIERLREAGELAALGSEKSRGEDYISELVSLADTRGLNEFANQVREASDKRRLQQLGHLMIVESQNGKTATAIIDEMAVELLKIRRSGSRDPQTIGSMLPQFDERLMAVRKGEVRYLRPPIEAIRDVIGRMTDVDFQLIAGKPGMGKSSFLRYDGLALALAGHPVLTFTYENSVEETLSWAVAHVAGVDNNSLMDSSLLSRRELERVEDAKAKITQAPWYIQEMYGGNCLDIKAIAGRFKLQRPLDLIQIDGMYLMGGRGESYERISSNAQGLRNLAQELHVPIQATTQFSRQSKNKDEPDIADLLYAGENPARQIMIMGAKKTKKLDRFPENWKDGKMITGIDLPAIVVYMAVKKNTNGRTGRTGDIKWIKPTNTFQSLQLGWET